jgi:hypothetical protein
MMGNVDVLVTAVREQTVINVFAEVEIPPIMGKLGRGVEFVVRMLILVVILF